jgi:DNA repair protein RecN (Recombination protein N)
MLLELRIRDYAVIERLTLRLGPGLNVLTGETGAGKSIVVGALSLLVGERAFADVVRPGAERAIVEGVFDAGSDPGVTEVLDELGIETDDGLVILRREVAVEGRNRAWINGASATATMVGRIGDLLVDLHGQHDHDRLLHAEAQRTILDAYAGAPDLAAELEHAWRAVAESRERLAHVETRRREVEMRADLLHHTASEIERAALREGEEEELEAEARLLDHAEELARLSTQLHETLYAAESSITARLDGVRRALAQLQRIDEGVGEWQPLLDEAFHGLQEMGRRMGDYAARIEHDPARLAEIHRRQDLLFRLKTRYGLGLADVIEAGRAARTELEQLDAAGFERSALEQQLSERRTRHAQLCASLTAKRRDAAGRLSSEITTRLPELGMDGGRFQVDLHEIAEPAAQGAERVEFRIAVNAGFDAQPLARVASGGELSRVMLALKSTLARVDRTPTLVFDEIDAGVGGRVAHRVTDALRAVAEHHQVFVVTHLPQIASRADQHLYVEKQEREGRASTTVRALEGDERVDELARLLGGDPESDASREHARAMLAG